MLSNMNILCFISKTITRKKNQDFSYSVMSFEVQSVAAQNSFTVQQNQNDTFASDNNWL